MAAAGFDIDQADFPACQFAPPGSRLNCTALVPLRFAFARGVLAPARREGPVWPRAAVERVRRAITLCETGPSGEASSAIALRFRGGSRIALGSTGASRNRGSASVRAHLKCPPRSVSRPWYPAPPKSQESVAHLSFATPPFQSHDGRVKFSSGHSDSNETPIRLKSPILGFATAPRLAGNQTTGSEKSSLRQNPPTRFAPPVEP